MKFTHLEWDSDFFSIKIGRLDIRIIDTLEEISDFVYRKKADGYKLIYLFGSDELVFPETSFLRLVDRKVIYEGIVLSNQGKFPEGINKYNSQLVSPDLLDLALLSGDYSRFKTDVNFEDDKFIRLYTRWIENSVNGTFADVVLVYMREGKVIGMVTVAIKDEIGTIGLLATAKQFQGQGVATNLVKAVFAYLHQHGARKLEVATQLQNIQACHFYEKMNLTVKSKTNIYHWWL